MHIALQIFTADKRRGGMERYTHDLATVLLGRGMRITTMATTFADDWPGERAVIDVRGSRAKQYAIFAAATVTADVVHAMQPVERADVYTPHSGFAPTLYNRGGWLRSMANRVNPKRRLVAKLEAQLAEQNTAFACLSEAQSLEAAALYFGNEPGPVIIRHGVDVEHFDPERAATNLRAELSIPAALPLALFISQNFKRKRLGFAIEAVRQCEASTHLLVVGRDSPAGYDTLGGRVHFVGAVADTFAAHAAADALILPTLDEPFGLVVLESLAMGNPVVLYETAGAAEVVREGVTGRIMHQPNDAQAWTKALDAVLTNRSGWRELCLASRPEISFDRHIDTLLQLYTSIR